MVTLCFVRLVSTGGVAIHSSLVIDASALSCRTSVVVRAMTSMNPYVVAERGQRGKQTRVQRATETAVTTVLDQIINLYQRRLESLYISVINLIIAWHNYINFTSAYSSLPTICTSEAFYIDIHIRSCHLRIGQDTLVP